MLAIDDVDLEHRGDVVVAQQRDQAGLVEEHRAGLGVGRSSRVQYLDRDVALEPPGPEAASQVNLGMPPCAIGRSSS
jgi:hypothetical protein